MLQLQLGKVLFVCTSLQAQKAHGYMLEVAPCRRKYCSKARMKESELFPYGTHRPKHSQCIAYEQSVSAPCRANVGYPLCDNQITTEVNLISHVWSVKKARFLATALRLFS